MTVLALTGCHRSGTSALARLLKSSSLDIGDHLIGSGIGNTDGHYEDLEIVSIHNTILNDNGRSWQVEREFVPYVASDIWQEMKSLVSRRSRSKPIWGFKDPRTCLFLGLWQHLIPDLKTVGIFRPAADVIWSMERRSYLDLQAERRVDDLESSNFWTKPDLGARVWTTHNKALLRWQSSHREQSVLLAFEDLANGPTVPAELTRRWGIELDTEATADIWDSTATSLASEPVVVHDDQLRVEIEGVSRALEELRAELRAHTSPTKASVGVRQ